MYHYVRDLPRTRYPRLKALLLDDFRCQLDELPKSYEVASLETALAFLRGEYHASRNLCLLTFDDGLKEHYAEVTPLLAERGIQGVFFLATSCLEESNVLPVHMNHLLMADLPFDTYRSQFLRRLHETDPERAAQAENEHALAASSYPWDTPEVANWKYFFNFVLDERTRDRTTEELFRSLIGPPAEVSRELYVSWEEARSMQSAGMAIGGHSHRHRPLSTLAVPELEADLRACREALDRELNPQSVWPFSYPYGKRPSFNQASVRCLTRLRFDCAFTTETGGNATGDDPYAIRRKDCKVILPTTAAASAR